MTIRIGLCTICFQHDPVDDALAMCAAAGATGVELWGRGHLPADAPAAEVTRVRRLAESLGVMPVAYGSYAKAGEEAWTSEVMAGLLDRVEDLGADRVRVWAGSIPSADATPADWDRVTADLRTWGDLAAARGLRLVVERHVNTLTDFGECARRLIDAVAHPAVRLNYQVPYPWEVAHYAEHLPADLRRHLPVSAHLHIQNYRADLKRVSIAEGIVDYARWRPLLAEGNFDGWAMLEFLPEITPITDPTTLARQELAALGRLLQG